MNSSFAPLGPRVRNSLITIGGAGVGDGDGLGNGEGLGDGKGLGDGEAIGVGVGVGVGLVIVSAAGNDSTPRAEAKTCATPARIPVANPNWLTITVAESLDLHWKITSLIS